MESGTASQRKALLQELVSEIRVESGHATYRLPNGPVRVMSGLILHLSEYGGPIRDNLSAR